MLRDVQWLELRLSSLGPLVGSLPVPGVAAQERRAHLRGVAWLRFACNVCVQIASEMEQS